MTAPHGHQAAHAHAHAHGTAGDLDWEAMSAELKREAELHAPALAEAADWLRGLLRDRDGVPGRVGRVLDVGSGAGGMTCQLARTFPGAEVVGVDGTPALLDLVRTRAAGEGVAGRVTTLRAELPGEFDALGDADLIWVRNVVHHLGDQRAALRALATRLRPGGLLAVGEGGLPARFLPRDIGMGRPGLQVRLDSALEEWFTAMRAEVPGTAATAEDWPALLADAGLEPTGTRSFLTDLPAPLGVTAREHLHARLSRIRERAADWLAAEDLASLDALLDGNAATGILSRPDAFYLSASTVHTARAPGQLS